MLFIRLRVCVNDILLYELCIYEGDFQLLSADVYGASATPVVFRWDMSSNVYYGSLWMGNHGLVIYFACLIRNHVKCYLVFLGFILMEILLNNLQAYKGRMGATKIFYQLLLKRLAMQR